MCGRFVRITPIPKIVKRFRVTRVAPLEPGPSYNIAPTHETLIVNNEGERQLLPARWGFIPSWSKDPSIGSRMINARAETVAEKPTFRHAFKKQRCLVIADGFFEWKGEGQRKRPMHVRLTSGAPFAFAGLYNIWASPSGEIIIYTCTIITTTANELLKLVHDRMPVILPKSKEDIWLDSSREDKEEFLELLRPYDADKMETWEVSPRVNNPGYDFPENIQPI
jgi:putative SOS response-associated peptidase YedK